MRRLLTATIALAFITAGCSESEPSAEPATTAGMSLAEAFCSDLEAGNTPFQILSPSVQDGTYTPQQAAEEAQTWASTACPDQLEANEALRSYLNNFGLDPDT